MKLIGKFFSNFLLFFCMIAAGYMYREIEEIKALQNQYESILSVYENYIISVENQIKEVNESISFEQKRQAKIKKIKLIVADTIKREKYASHLSASELNVFAAAVAEYAEAFSVPVSLVLAVARKESQFNPKAVSVMYAQGIMQVMPETAEDCAKELRIDYYDIYSIRDNVKFGTYYLSKMLKFFDGNKSMAIKAYNAGPSSIEKNFPLSEETVDYHLFVSAWQREYELKTDKW